jgi:uncharacterized protein YvpB
MKLNADKILNIAIILVFISLLLEVVYFYINRSEPYEAPEPEEIELVVEEPIEEPVEVVLPDDLILDVPFVCQAPLGSWSYPFDSACEETAILMVHYYLQGKSVDISLAAQEIKAIVDFEIEQYGFHKDTSSEQTAQLVRDYYDYEVEVVYDISLEDIKKELAKGNPVIVPTAGRILGNPYFTPPGPLLHMLVIKGFTPTEFIVNDPGTKRGDSYTYSYEILEEAIHDWGDGDVEQGRSAMIIIQK